MKLDTDAEKRTAELRMFVTPITRDLAREASPAIARTLFHEESGDPVQELDCPKFLVGIPVQSMSYRRHPDYVGHQVHVPNVKITNVTAQKVTPGDPNFSLIFSVGFEINDKTIITDLVDLIHEKFYVSFAPEQGELFSDPDPWESILCRLCDAPNPEWGVINSKPRLAYCSAHKDQKADDEKLERIRDSAAAAEVATQLSGDGEAKSQAAIPGTDIPPDEDGAFINQRNRKAVKKRVN